jgi:hypothetical protein
MTDILILFSWLEALHRVVTFRVVGNEGLYQIRRPESSPRCRRKSRITANQTAVGIMDGADLPQTPGRSTSGLTHISDADQLSGLHCIIGFAFEPRRPSKGQLGRR